MINSEPEDVKPTEGGNSRSDSEKSYGSFDSRTPQDQWSQHFSEITEEEPLLEVHYSIHGTVSTRQSLMYLVKANLGIAILAVPCAFHFGGIILGPLGMIGIGITAVLCFNMISVSGDKLCRELGRSKIDYAEIVELAFENGSNPIIRNLSKAGHTAINVLVTMGQLGNCSAYFLFLTGTLQDVLQQFQVYLSFTECILIMFIPVLCFGMVTNLNWLSRVSLLFNVVYLGSVVVIAAYLFTIIKDPFRLPYIAGINTLPLYFGSSIFCIESIGCIIPIKNKMRHPEKFAWVLNSATIFMFAMLISFGFIGYSVYGQDIQSSITYNLPLTPLFDAIHIGLAMSVFASYSVQIFPIVDIILPKIIVRLPGQKRWKLDVGLRLGLVTVTFLAALIVPELALFLDLIGAIVSSSLALIFPPLVYDCVLYMESSEWTRYRVFIRICAVLLVVGGVFGGITSAGVAITEIVRQWGSR